MRHAVRDDAAELGRLPSPLGYPVSADDVAAVWQAWQTEGNVRTTILHRPRSVGRITSLAVDPSARCLGLGRALVEAAEEAQARDGCGMVEVTSHVRRPEPHELYRHLGYERTSFGFVRELA